MGNLESCCSIWNKLKCVILKLQPRLSNQLAKLDRTCTRILWYNMYHCHYDWQVVICQWQSDLITFQTNYIVLENYLRYASLSLSPITCLDMSLDSSGYSNPDYEMYQLTGHSNDLYIDQLLKRLYDWEWLEHSHTRVYEPRLSLLS